MSSRIPLICTQFWDSTDKYEKCFAMKTEFFEKSGNLAVIVKEKKSVWKSVQILCVSVRLKCYHTHMKPHQKLGMLIFLELLGTSRSFWNWKIKNIFGKKAEKFGFFSSLTKACGWSMAIKNLPYFPPTPLCLCEVWGVLEKHGKKFSRFTKFLQNDSHPQFWGVHPKIARYKNPGVFRLIQSCRLFCKSRQSSLYLLSFWG